MVDVQRSGAAARIPLGRSGIEVAPMGWGMWRFAGADPATAQRRIETALEIGCTLFDTADIYGFSTPAGFGGAEELLGRVLRNAPGLRSRMVLASKAGIFPPLPYDSSTTYLVQACEKSLRRMGVECIDLWQIHRPDLLTHPAEVAGAFDRLRQSGKIRAAGVSNYSAAQIDALCEHMPFPLASIQPEFSALAISPLVDGVLDAAMRRGLAVLAWSPLGQGRLGANITPAASAQGESVGDRTAAVCAALDRIAARASLPRTAVAYAWVMAHPSRAVPLIGSQDPGRIREAAGAYRVQITREEWYQVLEAARRADAMSARTGLVAHERYFWHDTSGSIAHAQASPFQQPTRHYEHPDTKRRMLGLLEVSGMLEQLLRIAPREATLDELRRFHSSAYIDRVRALSTATGGEAGESAPVGRGSFEIALLAAGGCLAAGDAVMAGKVRNAYALVRPPGHHAEADRGRGYCLFNNAVLLVRHLQQAHGLSRVAVVDWDVHHGNGTETAFIDDATVLAISIHQERNYPVDSGGLDVVGNGAAAGTNLNIPLPAGSGHSAYLASFERVVLPALRRFRPEFLVIASGFDASMADPLGRMMCTSETYRELTRLLMSSAAELCAQRVVATHEGGYSNEYVPFCGLAVLEQLSGNRSTAADPWLEEYDRTAGSELLAHQDAAIRAAERLVAAVPEHMG